ncbi:hypothetical protein [Bowmanella dokdonensis]|uniref:Uncharacterized protein n=1 Tax=Bowmanella dokdonensis TaxID=751969 RepID=A0A939IT58_9ALTE|nr:hypothetical protein [Bowmanella dokdonensis]MBN7827131.1 hypothetical protein [Bowmanella dokdonensis]
MNNLAIYKSRFMKSKVDSQTLNWRAIEEVVEDVSNKSLVNCLDLILSDDQLLEAAARRSHRHQLGFLKFVLLANDPTYCLRMHLWDDESINIEEDIHSHCAHFSSRIVFGAIQENSYELIPGDAYKCFLYSFEQSLGHCVAKENGTTGVVRSGSRVLTKGNIYRAESNSLHNISQVKLGTLTVSAWGVREREALVLKNRQAIPKDCLVSSGIDLEELRSKLSKIKNRIEDI